VRITLIIALWFLCLRAFSQTAAQPPYPPPGKMIDIGGVRVHLNCTGAGPITVMIMGAGSSYDWSLVQPEVAKFTRVCTYDPPGGVWSDPSPAPTCDGWVAQIHSLLQRAGISGPIVPVGHSIGSVIARLYAATFPNSVQGLILSDYAGAYRFPNGEEMMRADEGSLERLPSFAQAMHRWAQSQAGNADPAATRKLFDGCIAEAAKTTIYMGHKPVVVVSNSYMAKSEDYQRVQTELLALSLNSKAMIAPHSGHSIPAKDPEVLVQAIREVVSSARSNTKLR
jgi:pimeloyl-ACP methyl ester carboxylesterase